MCKRTKSRMYLTKVLAVALALLVPLMSIVPGGSGVPVHAGNGTYILHDFHMERYGVAAFGGNSDKPNITFRGKAFTDTPIDLTAYGYSADEESNTVALQFDIWISNSNDYYLSGDSCYGTIKLTSSGTIEKEEISFFWNPMSLLEKEWVRVVIPLSSFASYGIGEFNPANLNYLHFSMWNMCEEETVKLCNVRLVDAMKTPPSEQEDPIGKDFFGYPAVEPEAILSHVVGEETLDVATADFDGDGRVTVGDARHVQQFFDGEITMEELAQKPTWTSRVLAEGLFALEESVVGLDEGNVYLTVKYTGEQDIVAGNFILSCPAAFQSSFRQIMGMFSSLLCKNVKVDDVKKMQVAFTGTMRSGDIMLWTIPLEDALTAECPLVLTTDFLEFADGSRFSSLEMSEAVQKSIAPVHVVLEPPVKTRYYLGEALDTTGLSFTLAWGEARSRTLTADNLVIKGFDASAVGTKTVSVHLGSYSSTFSVEIRPTVNYDYQEINDGNAVMITGFDGSETELEIPSTIDGKPVTAIGEAAFADLDTITEVVIPQGVTAIGARAFADCKALSAIVLPEGLQTIGEGAFAGDKALLSLKLPTSLTTIGKEAFYGCFRLSNLMLPSGITSIGVDALTNSGVSVIVFNGSQAQWNAVDKGEAIEYIGIAIMFTALSRNGTSIEYENGALFDADTSLLVDAVKDDKVLAYFQAFLKAAVWDICLMENGNVVQPNSMVKVRMPIPTGMDGADCRVIRVEADGTLTDMHATPKDGLMEFKTEHFSLYAVVSGEAPVEPIVPRLIGDVDGDGAISSTDARLTLQYYVGKIPESAIDVSVADVDDSGEVTSTDARLILQYYIGKIKAWP